jgi:hypothetical protein
MQKGNQKTKELQRIRSCPAYKVILREREALRAAGRSGAPGSTSTRYQQETSRQLSLPERIAPTDSQAEDRAQNSQVEPAPSTAPTLQQIRSCPAYNVLLREQETRRAAGHSGAPASASMSQTQGTNVQDEARTQFAHGEATPSTAPTLQQIRSCPAYKVILCEREALLAAECSGTHGSTSTRYQQETSRQLSLPERIAPTDSQAEDRAQNSQVEPTSPTIQPVIPSTSQFIRERRPDRSGDVYTAAELQQMDADLAFVVPTADDLAMIQRKAIAGMAEASSEVNRAVYASWTGLSVRYTTER